MERDGAGEIDGAHRMKGLACWTEEFGLYPRDYEAPWAILYYKNGATIFVGFLFLFYFWLHPCGMWKVPGQGLNLHHSSDLSHSSDNHRSLTHGATGKLHICVFGCSVCMGIGV